MRAEAEAIETRMKNLSPNWQYTMTRLLIPAVVKIVEAHVRRQASIRTALVAIASERFRLAKGRWPADLKELTPEYLKEIPDDPYTGNALKYTKLADGISVYSVGKDLKDDDGDIIRTKIDEPRLWDLNAAQGSNGTYYMPKDIGFRLWNPDKRAAKPAILKPVEQPKN
jgi:hypothetical protein